MSVLDHWWDKNTVKVSMCSDILQTKHQWASDLGSGTTDLVFPLSGGAAWENNQEIDSGGTSLAANYIHFNQLQQYKTA